MPQSTISLRGLQRSFGGSLTILWTNSALRGGHVILGINTGVMNEHTLHPKLFGVPEGCFYPATLVLRSWCLTEASLPDTFPRLKQE